MNKPNDTDANQRIQAEYDFNGGIRSKYAERYAEGSNIVVVEPDLVKRFPTSRAVNEALRRLINQSKK